MGKKGQATLINIQGVKSAPALTDSATVCEGAHFLPLREMVRKGIGTEDAPYRLLSTGCDSQEHTLPHATN